MFSQAKGRINQAIKIPINDIRHKMFKINIKN